jgi:hypothetical protein
MNVDVISKHLKRPPEDVRLRALYPELPHPIPFADGIPLGPWDEDEGSPPELRGCYYIAFDLPAGHSRDYAVTEQHHRIVEEYCAAIERQADAAETCAAARWEKRSPDGEPREPAPEAIPPRGELTPRQEEFCRHYATQPVALRAAVLAGYAESNADSYGPKLLKNPVVLERIAALRAAKSMRYVLERDTLHDKLEAIFFEALGDRNHAAAVAALRLQAGLGGLALRPSAPAEAKKKETGGKKRERAAKMPGNAGVLRRQKPGKARMRRRKMPGKARKGP